MPYNEKLANRLRALLEDVPDVEEKEMFRGLTFMVNGKMCISVSGMERLMVRIDPEKYDELIEKNGCKEVVMQGRVMNGFIYVYEDALKTKKELAYWVKLAMDYNPKAKSSKKKK
jgi:TfoX/Sxy family transcriptional regulator of competence genes